jgi:hypothetical protein
VINSNITRVKREIPIPEIPNTNLKNPMDFGIIKSG